HPVLARVAELPGRTHPSPGTRRRVGTRTEIAVVTLRAVLDIRVDAEEVRPAGADPARIVLAALLQGRLVAHTAVGRVADLRAVALVAVVARDRHAGLAVAEVAELDAVAGIPVAAARVVGARLRARAGALDARHAVGDEAERDDGVVGEWDEGHVQERQRPHHPPSRAPERSLLLRQRSQLKGAPSSDAPIVSPCW